MQQFEVKDIVDKSGLITKINELICTEQRYVCISRPRRFGKSMTANMLAAYYGREENTEELQEDKGAYLHNRETELLK